MSSGPQRGALARPVWQPPAISAGTLFGLFLAAFLARRTPLADAARPVMIALSTVAAAGIAIWGIKMTVDARVRGWASAVAGLVMVILGLYTANHVLR